jgi:hypothetical protein
MLLGRLSLGLCALWMAFGQVQARAQLFLIAGRSATNSPDPGVVALAWNPSPDPRATGYFLCWGLNSSACTNFLDVGNVTNATVAGMVPNVDYSFTIVTYDAAGDQSPPSNQITATVAPATPVVTTWPTASAITYGQTLASSTLSGGSANPPGTFAFTTPSTAPNAGTALQGVTYTPTDTVNYNTASNTVSVTVNKAAPSVTAWPVASAITYGQTLAASTLSGGSATPAGTFAFTMPSTAPNAGTALQSVTYTPTDTVNYNTTSSTVSVTVNKAAPSVTAWPVAGAITYGQTLAASTLSGGSATPAGTFAFTTPSTVPNVGTALQSVTYTPTDTANYNTASNTVSVTVNKAAPSVTAWPVASAITYGQTLASSTLSGGSVTPAGTFAFTMPSTAPNAGTALQSVTYTPTDTTNYNTASSTVSVTVNPKALTTTGITANDKVYDGNTTATLNTSNAVLAGKGPADTVTLNTAGAAGAFTNPDVGTAKTVLVSGFSLSGTEAANYTLTQPTTTASITSAGLTVTGIQAQNKGYDGTNSATLILSNAVLVGVVSGDTVTLDATNAVGVFADKNVGTGKLVTVSGLTLLGADAAKYTLTQPTLTATITPANAVVTVWPVASAITYGQTLAASTLSGGSATPAGSFAFTIPSTRPNAGTAPQSVTYTPTDTTNYNTVSSTVSVTVNKAAPSVTVWPVASAISYGQTLAASTLSGGSATPTGTFAFTTPSTAPNAGSALQSVTYTPTDTTNYNTASRTVSVTVNKAAPSVTIWPVASAITYGQTLAASTLSGGSATPAGTFAFTTPSTAPNAGTAPQSVTYTPTDTTNYNTASGTVSVTVNPKPLTVMGITANDKAYDGNTTAALNSSGATLVGTVSPDAVNLNTASATGTFTDPNVGTSKIVLVSGLTLSGADSGNYTLIQPTTTANITPAGLTVAAIEAQNKVYDGTNSATLIVSNAVLMGVLTGDTVTLDMTNAMGVFADKNVGTSKLVTVSGLTLLGPDAAKYTLTQPTANADITPASLTVTGVTAGDKGYDGITSAMLDASSAALDGLIGEDQVTLDVSGATAVFGDAAVGTGKAATVSGLAINGPGAVNYTLTQPVAHASITAATVTPSVTVSGKVYDGGTAATITGRSLSGVISNDDVNLGLSGTAAFADKNVGTDKLATVSGLSISGPDAANYTLASSVASATADILARAITVTAVADSKVYDGTSASAGVSAIIAGSLAGTDGAVWTQTFDSKMVGTGKTLTPGGAVADGNGGHNYTVSFLNNTSGIITANGLTVTGITANDKVYDGNTTATLNTTGATLMGIVPGDAVTLTTVGATGAFTNPDVGTAKTVLVSSLTLSGADAGNYALTQPITTANITQASSATALVSSANPSLQGSNMSFTATATPVDPASTPPTGNVQFYTNGVALGSPVALTDGVGSLSAADLPAGTNTVLAAYLGDSNFIGSSNSLAQLVVVVAGRPSTPSTIGIQNNADGTVTVTFAGTPDAQYVVQASDNLAPAAWENVSTNTAGTDGQWTFTESTGHHSVRFYRSARP